MELKDLKANPKNPRKVTPAKLKALKRSLEEFGDLGGFVFNRRSGMLVGGHQRAKVFPKNAKVVVEQAHATPTEKGTIAAGYVEIKGERFSYREVDWDEDREKAANIAANKGAGEWDPANLGDWFKDLASHGFDLDLTMFDASEREAFLKEPEQAGTEGLTDPDEVPEDVETRCKPGDLWQLGNHRLLCGDSTDVLCVEKLMGGQKADMVFTDPPYGISYQSYVRKKKFDVLKNDDSIIHEWLGILPIVSEGFVFVWTAWKVLSTWTELTKKALGEITNIVVWDKGGGGLGDLTGSFVTDYELAIVFNRGAKLTGKRIGSVWSVGKDGSSSYLHPTQKPVDLAVMAFDSCCNPKAKVLDLFLGSGSTLIACEKTNRTCYGMELDPKYCDVILTRWEKFTGKTALLSAEKTA